jgi:uncharacterized membrane protein
MLSNRIPKTSIVNVEINMFFDGLFHAFAYLMTALGIALFFRAAQKKESVLSAQVFVGAMALGRGLFNLIEGLIDHEILQLHHVYENGDHLLYDLLFLGSGALLIALGGMLVRLRNPVASS